MRLSLKLPPCPVCGAKNDDPRRPAVYCRACREVVEILIGRQNSGGRAFPAVEVAARSLRAHPVRGGMDAPHLPGRRRRKKSILDVSMPE